MPQTRLFVYAHWEELVAPTKMGVLEAEQIRGNLTFNFEYDKTWLKSRKWQDIDPDIQFYEGRQYMHDTSKPNFGVFLDSMPDTWGRRLIKRREQLLAKEENRRPKTLNELDYLLGVYDKTRMGAIRFKKEEKGLFLDANTDMAAPPWASINEIQQTAEELEKYDLGQTDTIDRKWLDMLIVQGSSLGGARPKANVEDSTNQLWIAKFPSQNDDIDKAAWEFLAYQLAIACGIEMVECKIEKIAGHRHNTFFTKRFDRKAATRIHFASAMTMTRYSEGKLQEEQASYLDIADFIHKQGCQIKADLSQLWKRMVFNILVSNTDDHLRNHGFLLTPKGWKLSPAYDLNPSIDKDYLALTIDGNSTELDLKLALEVGEFFQLTSTAMNQELKLMKDVIKKWQTFANQIGISRREQEDMNTAFNNA